MAAPQAFSLAQTLVPPSTRGPAVALAQMTAEDACMLGAGLARLEPWSRLGFDGERLGRLLAVTDDGALRFKILVGSQRAGAVVVRFPWLNGPYLNFLGVLPEYQRRGVGAAVLSGLEDGARLAGVGNVWLCVSIFNTAAQAFYERHGYRAVAQLDDLIQQGQSEILMRRRVR
jgi:ribosomal protein S18 acetylase RimI-like enzyme